MCAISEAPIPHTQKYLINKQLNKKLNNKQKENPQKAQELFFKKTLEGKKRKM